MKIFDHTFTTPEENLACDEALLDMAEEDSQLEVLRFWQPTSHFVVLGYSNPLQKEVFETACLKNNVPILRRCSGGGTVLQGPGCLNYSLILRISRKDCQTITGANQAVMKVNSEILKKVLAKNVAVEGHTDLAIDGVKFSGNAQRRKSKVFLFHGTFLLNMNLNLMEKYLNKPTQEPLYRKSRSHKDFLMNLNIQPDPIKKAMMHGWLAKDELSHSPEKKIQRLALETYADTSWINRY